MIVLLVLALDFLLLTLGIVLGWLIRFMQEKKDDSEARRLMYVGGYNQAITDMGAHDNQASDPFRFR